MRPDILKNITDLSRSFTARLSVLALIFIFVPIILYGQIKAADEEKNMLLRSSLEQRGRLIAEALRPALQEFESEAPESFHNIVARLGDSQTKLRLLYRPNNTSYTDGFFYVASSPADFNTALEEERRTLANTGVLKGLAQTCERTSQQFLRFTTPDGREEIITSLTPLHLSNGCWVVTTSNAAAGLLGSSIGRPFWRSPDIQLAGLVYLLTAGVICWLIVDIWRSVSRFRKAARTIRLQGVDGASFAKLNEIPELSGVAEDFDSLVAALAESQGFIKKAAEENAHALKAPLAVIAQAVEPLKRNVDLRDSSAQRSIELIEQSVARLGALVSAARELDQADAAIAHSRRRRLNMSVFLERLLSSYQAGLEAKRKHLTLSIEPDIFVLANEDLLEPVVENLLENAASFAPAGSVIEVHLWRRGGAVEFSVGDRGPGVDPAKFEQIFERYFSERPPSGRREHAHSAERYFGLGLWIVKRNVEGLGGAVRVRNRKAGGLMATVMLKASASFSRRNRLALVKPA